MSFQIHSDPKKLQITSEIGYFTPPYLISQHYHNLKVFESENMLLPVVLQDRSAISLPRSPFGSFYGQGKVTEEQYDSFASQVSFSLISSEVRVLEIRHPPPIYHNFIDLSLLIKNGNTIQFEDVNQHIELSADWESNVHSMQKRKLKSLYQEDFQFSVLPSDQLHLIYRFIEACRAAQGLEINISWDLLQQLSKHMPGTYECFGVFRNEKISAACISARVSSEVAYYYLPATSPLFRSQSPMVLLIAGMVDHYRNEGFKYLDLGVSSIQGKAQETLRLFKERMGAIQTKKTTLRKDL